MHEEVVNARLAGTPADLAVERWGLAMDKGSFSASIEQRFFRDLEAQRNLRVRSWAWARTWARQRQRQTGCRRDGAAMIQVGVVVGLGLLVMTGGPPPYGPYIATSEGALPHADMLTSSASFGPKCGKLVVSACTWLHTELESVA